MGSGFDQFYPHVFGWPETFELRLRTHDHAPVQSLRLQPLRFDDWLQLDNAGRPWRSNFADSTQWRMVNRDTALLRVPTFVNYRKPADAQALFSRAMQELRAAGARHLLLDLRDNGGGSDDAALALLDHLTLQPYTYQRAVRLKNIRYGDLPRHIESWGDRKALFEPPEADFIRSADGWYDRRPELQAAVLMPRKPAPGAFHGRVTVLTSPVNASGATMVIAKLRDLGRATLIGGPCGGSADGATAGRIFNLKLQASGIAVRIPVAFNQMNVDRFDPRGGVQPDRLVEETVEDFRSGRDVVMEAALGSS
jgi:C-terminal processing protease CtpA/Prc